MTALEKYLARHADLERWPLVSGDTAGIAQAVVIPVMAERDTLFSTLDSLAADDPDELARTLVVCVVNNRPGAGCMEENQETLRRLWPLMENGGPLRLACVDASSPGCELPGEGGVGLARKIGMDRALGLLAHNGFTRGALVCLDADTRVQPGYLRAIRETLSRASAWAAVIDYAHPIELSPAEAAAIVCYETFLRYHVMGLRMAGSPYAFHTIGSAMACRADAYAAVSGMKPRQAGEDFYFLQALAKTGPVALIHDTVVWPSARPSVRVPFGTGARVRRHLAGMEDEYRLYDPRGYLFLRDWLLGVESRPDAGPDVLLADAGPLRAFLEARRFADIWPRLQANSRDARQALWQFHRWFDGFSTIKCLHYLRDNGFPPVKSFDALAFLASEVDLPLPELGPGIEHDLERQKAVLWRLRDWAASDPGPRGIA
ncbi:MAG TPA: glycosyltransferase family 2 protein [Candidatus Hydrogenedentes bacterium]|nr:glycosyltransferase family 2 protein [Candidatus Hydrogenedentota bacterium]